MGLSSWRYAAVTADGRSGWLGARSSLLAQGATPGTARST